MKDQIESKNYQNLRSEVHSLKGASAYLAAGRIHLLSGNIQQSIDQSNYENVVKLYPRLIEESIILRLHIKKLTYQRKSINVKRYTLY